MALDSKIPEGFISDKWTNHKNHLKLVAPNNRPKIDIIVVGTGLAGANRVGPAGTPLEETPLPLQAPPASMRRATRSVRSPFRLPQLASRHALGTG